MEASEVAAELAVELPENVHADGSYVEIGLNDLHAQTVGAAGRALVIFLGAACLLLLLGVMNAATLLLARSLERSREIGVRLALGGSRGRVVCMLASEAVLLSLAGGAIGILLTRVGVGAFLRYAPSSVPRQGEVAVDARVLAVVSVLASLAPARRGSIP